MQWITFCTLHYTLCSSADFNWITHCVIQCKITSNDNSFYSYAYMVIHHALHTGFGISISSPCWNQKAWNHIHTTWIIRYKLCCCFRKKCIFLIHISGSTFYANLFDQCKCHCHKLLFSLHANKHEFLAVACFFICAYCLSSGYLICLQNSVRFCSKSLSSQFS